MINIGQGQLNSRAFISINALIFLVIFNYPFLGASYNAAAQTENTSILFMLALPALLFALLHTFLSLILWPRSEKWVLTFLYVVSSAVLYAQMSYRVVFDYTMIQNVFETDASEATSYLASSTILTLGILIAAIRAVISKAHQIGMQLLDRALLLARPRHLPPQPSRQPVRVRIQLARPVRRPETRLDHFGSQVLA
jgi:glucan phosphoethanolaminetransferase (alkaline phosphatase superfamily)